MSSSAGINLLRKERWLNLTFTNTLSGSMHNYIKNCRYVMILKDIFYIHICSTFRFALYVGLINSHGVLYKNVNTNSIRMLAYNINYIILIFKYHIQFKSRKKYKRYTLNEIYIKHFRQAI